MDSEPESANNAKKYPDQQNTSTPQLLIEDSNAEHSSCSPQTRPELEKIRNAHQEEKQLTEEMVFGRGINSLKIEKQLPSYQQIPGAAEAEK